MYNKFMKQSDLNVTIGARVVVHGFYGTVTEVIKGINAENNEPYTNVRVRFDEDEPLAKFGQYQDGEYGFFTVLRS